VGHILRPYHAMGCNPALMVEPLGMAYRPNAMNIKNMILRQAKTGDLLNNCYILFLFSATHNWMLQEATTIYVLPLL